MANNKLIMISAFPPPIGGAAKNSLKIMMELQNIGSDVMPINSSPGILSHSRGIPYHIKRIQLFAINIIRLFSALNKNAKVLYFVPDGGLGLIYTLCYIQIASLFKINFYIHYRNFSYIENKNKLLDAILNIVKKRSCHIFLDEYMREKFFERYPNIKSRPSLICYNTGFLDSFNEIQITNNYPVSHPIVIGHLSNLCYEKGLYDFCRLIEDLNSTPLINEITFKIAGAAVSKADQAVIDAVCRNHSNVEILGHIEGQEKREFFHNCDFFVFPTRFGQEAQPNVIWEALAEGAYPVCYEKGSISWMLQKCTGSLANEQNIAETMTRLIREFDVSKRCESKKRNQGSVLRVINDGKKQFTQITELLSHA